MSLFSSVLLLAFLGVSAMGIESQHTQRQCFQRDLEAYIPRSKALLVDFRGEEDAKNYETEPRCIFSDDWHIQCSFKRLSEPDEGYDSDHRPSEQFFTFLCYKKDGEE